MSSNFYINLFAALFLLLLGSWYLVFNLRVSYLSGFGFYRWSGLAYMLAILALAGWFWLTSEPLHTSLLVASLLTQLGSRFWESAQEIQARQTDPERWKLWKEMSHQAGVLGRMLLFPGSQPLNK